MKEIDDTLNNKPSSVSMRSPHRNGPLPIWWDDLALALALALALLALALLCTDGPAPLLTTTTVQNC
ncbi:hypothetical protein VTH06DRAFT_4535 [Thermothelomyces fergusii]